MQTRFQKILFLKNDVVDLNELSKFYLPNTDAGAHKGWLNEIETKGPYSKQFNSYGRNCERHDQIQLKCKC